MMLQNLFRFVAGCVLITGVWMIGAWQFQSKVNADVLPISDTDLVFSEVPIGTIVAYVGPLNILPKKWQPCDGRLIDDPGNPFHNRRLPNLMNNSFMMGVSAASDVLETGGTNTIDWAVDHSHTGKTNNPRDVYEQKEGFGRTSPETWHEHGIEKDGRHNHGGENRPAYQGVQFIILIR